MTTMTEATAHLLNMLRVNTESTVTRDDGSRWGQVYLNNAIPHGWTRHQFAGHLSDLKKHGLYRSQDDNYFGDVKLED